MKFKFQQHTHSHTSTQRNRAQHTNTRNTNTNLMFQFILFTTSIVIAFSAGHTKNDCKDNCATCTTSNTTAVCIACSTGFTLTENKKCIAGETSVQTATVATPNPASCPCPGFTPCSTSPHSLKLASDITLSWRLCPACPSLSLLPTISFLAIVPATTAWFAVGFRPATEANKNTMAMKTTDMTVCESNQISDYWSENRMPAIDLENNIFNASITTSNSFKEYQWSRHFNTKDTAKDHVLTVADVFEWIWVLETDASNTITAMPKRRGKFTTSLADHSIDNSGSSNNLVEEGNLQNVRLAHGIIMGCGWGIFMPISALAARYSRGSRSSWLNEHVALTKIGAAGTISFIIVAIAAGPANLGNFHTHALVGILFAIFVLSVTISGSLAKAGLKNEAKNRGSNTMRGCRIFHNVVGWMLMFVAFYQIPLGIEVLFSGMEAAASQVGSFKNYNSDGTLKTNVILKIAVLGLNFFFLFVVIFMECKRWKTGYYVKSGGCIHSCGYLDKQHDAFMMRTLKRFTTEGESVEKNGIEMSSASASALALAASSLAITEVRIEIEAESGQSDSTRGRNGERGRRKSKSGRGRGGNGGRGSGRSNKGSGRSSNSSSRRRQKKQQI